MYTYILYIKYMYVYHVYNSKIYFKALNKCKYVSCLQNWSLNIIKITIIHKLTHKFNEIKYTKKYTISEEFF